MEKRETDHERFGELSALAILGQVSAEEYDELRAHLQSCAACRQQHDALARILLADLPLARDENEFGEEQYARPRQSKTSLRNPRAAESAAFGNLAENSASTIGWRQRLHGKRARVIYARAAVLLVFLMAGGLGIRVAWESKVDKLRDAGVASLNGEIAGLRDQVHGLEKRAKGPISPEAAAPTTAKSAENGGLESERAKLLAWNRELDAQLKARTEELVNLKQEASSGMDRERQVSARLAETQDTLEKLATELKTVRESHSQDAFIVAKQQSQLLDAEEKLAAATSSMDRDRKLLVADRDIRDLMGARNLRIIDVFDVDGKGKTRKPFGRVFFTEGKSLVFYAFDLGDDRRGLQSAAYQAWGSEGSFEHGVRSLGIFYRDDQKANRWVLKFDDPGTLAEIDSVFVTTEPAGGSKRPTGGRLLAAYVKASLNHP